MAADRIPGGQRLEQRFKRRPLPGHLRVGLREDRRAGGGGGFGKCLDGRLKQVAADKPSRVGGGECLDARHQCRASLLHKSRQKDRQFLGTEAAEAAGHSRPARLAERCGGQNARGGRPVDRRISLRGNCE